MPAARTAQLTTDPASRRRARGRRVAVAAVAAGLAVGGLSSCAAGGPDTTVGSGSSAEAANNAADTEFAQMMVIHHEGAIEMADAAVDRAATDDVRALAERISAAQGPEIDTMTGWLERWGEDMPHDADMGDMGHGGMDMDGMDQEAAMDELRGLEGEEFDRRFLELMIDHHEGALEMSEEHLGDGQNPAALELAVQIVAAQEAEIAEMREMLDGL